MKKLLGITAALAGLGAAAWWLKNNVTVDIKKEETTPEEKAEMDALEEEAAAKAEAKTEAELKNAQGNPVMTAVALAKGWLRRHVAVTYTVETATDTGEEPAADAAGAEIPEEAAAETAEEAPAETAEGPAAGTPASPADDGPNPNPVEAAPAAAPVDENGKLDATALASPEDFADWDQHGCRG